MQRSIFNAGHKGLRLAGNDKIRKGEVEQLGQPAEEEISEVAGSNPALTLILSKSCVPTQGVSRKPFTAEGKSAADAYICHMYDLLAYQEHMP